ncbi:MAG: hypothetical protein NC117_03180 [Pseudoflavonifractor sp.]|nr:hypothetical protein [Pseudoflavonifractor sp.]
MRQHPAPRGSVIISWGHYDRQGEAKPISRYYETSLRDSRGRVHIPRAEARGSLIICVPPARVALVTGT